MIRGVSKLYRELIAEKQARPNHFRLPVVVDNQSRFLRRDTTKNANCCCYSIRSTLLSLC